jgi:prepilin-type N-terminal cleavage/methylation domain-containing protein
MKRAFTLIELLVVIAIIAILAAILFPVFAQAKASAKAAADLSNVKEQATAVATYTADHDDFFPLQCGRDSVQWGYNFMKLAPWDWPVSDNGGIIWRRMQYSQNSYMNTIQPYMKSWALCVAPGAPDKDGFHSCQSYPLAVGKIKQKTTYAFNGFLTSYSGTSVANPAIIPLLTEQNGFAAGVGVTFANPALTCDDPLNDCKYQPAVYNPDGTIKSCATGNGGSGGVYGNFGSSSFWCNKKGANWSFTDGHAKFRSLGMTLAPDDTDGNTDPMTKYDTTGNAGYYYTDGLCFAWLYRPDFNDQG